MVSVPGRGQIAGDELAVAVQVAVPLPESVPLSSADSSQTDGARVRATARATPSACSAEFLPRRRPG